MKLCDFNLVPEPITQSLKFVIFNFIEEDAFKLQDLLQKKMRETLPWPNL